MAKQLSDEALLEQNSALKDDIIRLADRVKELEQALSGVGDRLLDMELDEFEATRDCDAAEAKWNDLRFSLRDYGGHRDSCPAWPRTANGLHHACNCGWNFYATKLERAFNRDRS